MGLRSARVRRLFAWPLGSRVVVLGMPLLGLEIGVIEMRRIVVGAVFGQHGISTNGRAAELTCGRSRFDKATGVAHDSSPSYTPRRMDGKAFRELQVDDAAESWSTWRFVASECSENTYHARVRLGRQGSWASLQCEARQWLETLD